MINTADEDNYTGELRRVIIGYGERRKKTEKEKRLGVIFSSLLALVVYLCECVCDLSWRFSY